MFKCRHLCTFSGQTTCCNKNFGFGRAIHQSSIESLFPLFFLKSENFFPAFVFSQLLPTNISRTGKKRQLSVDLRQKMCSDLSKKGKLVDTYLVAKGTNLKLAAILPS
jgi:hypothetical protein